MFILPFTYRNPNLATCYFTLLQSLWQTYVQRFVEFCAFYLKLFYSCVDCFLVCCFLYVYFPIVRCFAPRLLCLFSNSFLHSYRNYSSSLVEMVQWFLFGILVMFETTAIKLAFHFIVLMVSLWRPVWWCRMSERDHWHTISLWWLAVLSRFVIALLCYFSMTDLIPNCWGTV